MAKLTKQQVKDHETACGLLTKDTLTLEDKDFIFTHWHEGATNMNGKAGAFFTPLAMAFDMAFDISGKRVIDLCAGIGVLSYAVQIRAVHGYADGKAPEIVCVEKNPEYVEVGKKLVPEAIWICGDVTDPVLMASLGHFDCAYGNPPFGTIKGSTKAPRSSSADFEYKVMDIASDLADTGTFIIPQHSASFRYSGQRQHSDGNTEKSDRFTAQTGITMNCGTGVDTAYHLDDWKDVKPLCEIVCCDFEEARAARRPKPAAPRPAPIRTPAPIAAEPEQLSFLIDAA